MDRSASKKTDALRRGEAWGGRVFINPRENDPNKMARGKHMHMNSNRAYCTVNGDCQILALLLLEFYEAAC